MGHKRTIEAAEAGGKQYELALLYTDEAFFDLLEMWTIIAGFQKFFLAVHTTNITYAKHKIYLLYDGQSKDKMVIYLPFHIYTQVYCQQWNFL